MSSGSLEFPRRGRHWSFRNEGGTGIPEARGGTGIPEAWSGTGLDDEDDDDVISLCFFLYSEELPKGGGHWNSRNEGGTGIPEMGGGTGIPEAGKGCI